MDKFQTSSIVIMLVFYGIYFGKMLGQKKKGIRTNQIAKGEKQRSSIHRVHHENSTPSAYLFMNWYLSFGESIRHLKMCGSLG